MDRGSPGHPFYARLTTLRDGHHFDRFVEGLRPVLRAMGRPSLAPGRYFRLLLVGSFEGIAARDGVARDGLVGGPQLSAVGRGRGATRDIARTRRLIDLETGVLQQRRLIGSRSHAARDVAMRPPCATCTAVTGPTYRPRTPTV